MACKARTWGSAAESAEQTRTTRRDEGLAVIAGSWASYGAQAAIEVGGDAGNDSACIDRRSAATHPQTTTSAIHSTRTRTRA